MTPERKATLEAIPGWFWEHEEVWNQTCNLLREYVNEYKKLPPNKKGIYKETNLGMWINNQRTNRKKGKLTPEREAALEAIPRWFWEQEEVWNETCNLLCEYVKEYQKLPPNKKGIYKETNLGMWINTQRQNRKSGKMTPKREAALEAIPEWFWEQDLDETWNQTCNLLREYVKEYQKLPHWKEVYKETNLGSWVHTQRKNRKKHSLTKIKLSVHAVLVIDTI